MQLEVSRLVAHSKVVLGHLGLGCVKGHLVPGEPALVADNGGTMNGGSGEVEVHVAAQVDELALVGGLDLSALLPFKEKGRKEFELSNESVHKNHSLQTPQSTELEFSW